MNDTLDNSLEANFNTAMKMSAQEHSYDELIELLRSDKVVEKQIAVLKLEEIMSKEDAEILVSNLVGQDGKIREAVAFKINELIQNSEYYDYFQSEKNFETFLQGIMDINGNVCRQIVNLSVNNEFMTYLTKKLPNEIYKILETIEKIDAQSRQYVISKRNFQLYWALEALYNIIESVNINEIFEIIFKTGDFKDYTIREKTAKILTKIDSAEFSELKEKLKNDENYYVRRYLIVK